MSRGTWTPSVVAPLPSMIPSSTSASTWTTTMVGSGPGSRSRSWRQTSTRASAQRREKGAQTPVSGSRADLFGAAFEVGVDDLAPRRRGGSRCSGSRRGRGPCASAGCARRGSAGHRGGCASCARGPSPRSGRRCSRADGVRGARRSPGWRSGWRRRSGPRTARRRRTGHGGGGARRGPGRHAPTRGRWRLETLSVATSQAAMSMAPSMRWSSPRSMATITSSISAVVAAVSAASCSTAWARASGEQDSWSVTAMADLPSGASLDQVGSSRSRRGRPTAYRTHVRSATPSTGFLLLHGGQAPACRDSLSISGDGLRAAR